MGVLVDEWKFVVQVACGSLQRCAEEGSAAAFDVLGSWHESRSAINCLSCLSCLSKPLQPTITTSNTARKQPQFIDAVLHSYFRHPADTPSSTRP